MLSKFSLLEMLCRVGFEQSLPVFYLFNSASLNGPFISRTWQLFRNPAQRVPSCNTAISSFRVCRQLLALGLFCQPDFRAKVDPKLSRARRCLYDGGCAICCNGHLSDTKECLVWRRSFANFWAARSLCCSSRALRSGVWSACATSSAVLTRWSDSCRLSSFIILHVQMRCSPKT